MASVAGTMESRGLTISKHTGGPELSDTLNLAEWRRSTDREELWVGLASGVLSDKRGVNATEKEKQSLALINETKVNFI